MNVDNAKTEIDYRPDSNAMNEATRVNHLAHEVFNSVANHHVLMEAILSGRARDIKKEPKVKRDPCIVIGSGPSLDLHIEKLRDWKGGLICTTSHAQTLMYHGIEPTHIMALDPFSLWDEIGHVDWAATNTKLITNPGVWPDVIANWPNEILLYRMNLGTKMPFYLNEQNIMYSERVPEPPGQVRAVKFEPYIPTGIAVFACSPPMQMFAADILGYGTTFLVGVDFCYHSDRSRFTGWAPNELGEWEPTVSHWPEPDGSKPDANFDNKYIVTDNGYDTHQIHIYYKKNTISAWRMSGQNVYVVPPGSITEMPEADIDKLIETQGKGWKRWSYKQIAKVTDKYLAERGSYVIEASTGKNFVEAQSIDQMVSLMMAMRRNYKCTNCTSQMKANTDEDHTGEVCPACKSGQMLRASDVDIEKNLRRLNRLEKLYVKSVAKPGHPGILPSAGE